MCSPNRDTSCVTQQSELKSAKKYNFVNLSYLPHQRLNEISELIDYSIYVIVQLCTCTKTNLIK